MLRRGCYRVGAHYQKRATPILGLCHGIFTDLFIFRHILWVPDLHRFSVFMWTGETIRLRCVRMGIFLNTETTSPFSKNIRILVDGALVIKLCLLLLRPLVIRCQDHLSPTKIRNCFRNLNSLHIKSSSHFKNFIRVFACKTCWTQVV